MYNYLVASLPMIFFGDPPPFSGAEFLRRCGGVLTPDHAAAVARTLRDEPSPDGPPAEAFWHARLTQLRNAVAAARAQRAGGDARGTARPHAGYDVYLAQAANDAFAQANPLERELALDRARWRALDELAHADPFGPGAVIAFAGKLRVAERWAALGEEKGRARVEELIRAATREETLEMEILQGEEAT